MPSLGVVRECNHVCSFIDFDLQNSRNLYKPAMEGLTEHIYFLSDNLYAAKLFFIMNTFSMETFFFILQEFLLVFGDQESFKEPAK
jgi:hypothetical protein